MGQGLFYVKRSTERRDICAFSSSLWAISLTLLNLICPPRLKQEKGGVRFSKINVRPRVSEILRVSVTLLSFLLGGPVSCTWSDVGWGHSLMETWITLISFPSR